MGLQEILKRIYHTFLLVWALIGVIICIMSLIMDWFAIEANHFVALFIIAGIGSMTYILFYSKSELSIRQLAFRLAIQFCIIMGSVLSIGYHVGLVGYDCHGTTIVTIVSTFLLSAVVPGIELYKTWRIADKLNLKLRDRAKR